MRLKRKPTIVTENSNGEDTSKSKLESKKSLIEIQAE
jgi:hypothetical protein